MNKQHINKNREYENLYNSLDENSAFVFACKYGTVLDTRIISLTRIICYELSAELGLIFRSEILKNPQLVSGNIYTYVKHSEKNIGFYALNYNEIQNYISKSEPELFINFKALTEIFNILIANQIARA